MSLEGVVVESLDLSQLTDADLAGMLAAFRELALTRNRIALDLYAIVEKEMLSRHRSLEITDYTDDELNKAVACLCCAVDAARKGGLADDYPGVKFLLATINGLLDEMESRGLVHALQ